MNITSNLSVGGPYYLGRLFSIIYYIFFWASKDVVLDEKLIFKIIKL